MGNSSPAELCYENKKIELSYYPPTLDALDKEVKINRGHIEKCNELEGGGRDFFNGKKRELVAEAWVIAWHVPHLWTKIEPSEIDLSSPPQRDLFQKIHAAAGPLQNPFHKSFWFGGLLGGIIGCLGVGPLTILPEVYTLAQTSEVSLLSAFKKYLPGKITVAICGALGIIAGTLICNTFKESYHSSSCS